MTSELEGPYTVQGETKPTGELAGPYNPNPPPAPEVQTVPTPESGVGKLLRDSLPVGADTKKYLADHSPEWSEVGNALNTRVDYLYDRMKRGLLGEERETLPSPDVFTRIAGGVMENAVSDPLAFMVSRPAAIAGSAVGEFLEALPKEKREWLGAVTGLGPRAVPMLINAIQSALHPTSSLLHSLTHVPFEAVRFLANPRNIPAMIVGGHTAGAEHGKGSTPIDYPPANALQPVFPTP